MLDAPRLGFSRLADHGRALPFATPRRLIPKFSVAPKDSPGFPFRSASPFRPRFLT
jgi:hypothetical protein